GPEGRNAHSTRHAGGTAMNQPNVANSAPQANSSPQPTGFDILERLLHEYRDTGRSATLDRWTRQFKQRLAKFRAANKARSEAEVAVIERALNLSLELMEEIRPKKPNKT